MSIIEKTNRIILAGKTSYFLIPNGILKDSSFPFNLDKDVLSMKIDKEKILIEKMEEK